jgi:hypothetical protein
MNDIHRIKYEARIHSLYISLAYVGIGTLSLFAMGWKVFTQYELIAIGISLINLITIPVCFLGFGILYGNGAESWPLVLGIQIMVFLIFWYLLYRYLLKRYSNEKG